jgi:hypothetical protein
MISCRGFVTVKATELPRVLKTQSIYFHCLPIRVILRLRIALHLHVLRV